MWPLSLVMIWCTVGHFTNVDESRFGNGAGSHERTQLHDQCNHFIF